MFYHQWCVQQHFVKEKHYSVSFWQMWSVIRTPSLFRRLKEFTLLKIVAIKLMTEELFIKHVIKNLTTFVLLSMTCATALCQWKILLPFFFLTNLVCYCDFNLFRPFVGCSILLNGKWILVKRQFGVPLFVFRCNWFVGTITCIFIIELYQWFNVFKIICSNYHQKYYHPTFVGSV